MDGCHAGSDPQSEKDSDYHWRTSAHFLGYALEGRSNVSGTGWLYLSVPRDAIRKVTAKIQQATRYPQAPEYDVFQNINAIARGWSNYYRYAYNMNRVGGKLSMIIYWRTAHYLGKRRPLLDCCTHARCVCPRSTNRLFSTLRCDTWQTPNSRASLFSLA